MLLVDTLCGILHCCITEGTKGMAETIIINAATREIKVPDSEINFGVAGERKIERKHFRIEGRTYKGVDLADGFAWKVSCENAAKKPCADLITALSRMQQELSLTGWSARPRWPLKANSSFPFAPNARTVWPKY